MGIFNGYPASYQPPVYFQQPGLTWVQGEAAAKSYLVAPGATVALWDSEEKTIYLKSADASGMPTMKVLDYTIRGAEPEKKEEYATKADLAALEEKIRALGRRREKEDTDDE